MNPYLESTRDIPLKRSHLIRLWGSIVRPIRRFAVIAGLILLGSFFLRISIIPNPTNYEFLSIGVLSGFLAALEVVTLAKRKDQWSDPTWQTNLQQHLRKSGIAALLIGTVLAVYGLFSLNNTVVYGAYYISFYGGLVMIAMGRVILFLSKFMPVKTEKWREQIMAQRRA
ncbi:MAG: hypothetical protein ACRECH_17930 [Nitrososphaerales archaeon]